MTTVSSILWRLGLALGALILLGSCGIEQSAPTSPYPSQEASTVSPTPATAIVSIPPHTTITAPAPTILPSSTASNHGPKLTTTPPNQQQPARLTVTLADDGKTITLQMGERFLLDLGALYSWQIAVTNASILNQVPNSGDKINQGWFEASRQGSTTLTATGTPLCSNAVPRCLMPSRLFALRIIVAGGTSPDLTVTMADDGKTISLPVGQKISLSLGQDYDWTVTVDNLNIVSRVANDSALKGAQGVWEAKRAGTTTLRATGIIICPPGRACIQIAIEFRVQLVVR